MWTWLNCYLSGRHDFGITCEPGAVYLRCIHCGKRSNGWAIEDRALAFVPGRPPSVPQTKATASGTLPFAPRGAARQVKSA